MHYTKANILFIFSFSQFYWLLNLFLWINRNHEIFETAQNDLKCAVTDLNVSPVYFFYKCSIMFALFGCMEPTKLCSSHFHNTYILHVLNHIMPVNDNCEKNMRMGRSPRDYKVGQLCSSRMQLVLTRYEQWCTYASSVMCSDTSYSKMMFAFHTICRLFWSCASRRQYYIL